MIQRRLAAAVLAAGALLLTACSSTSGTAVAQTTTSSTSSSAASTPVSETSDEFTEPSQDSSADDTSADSTSSDGSDSSDGDTTSSEDTGAVDPSIIDAPTEAWFDAYCTGLAPLTDMDSLSSDISAAGTDLTQIQSVIVTKVGALGTALTSTSTTLSTMPPPTFSGGDTLAGTVIAKLADSGSKITSSVAEVQAVNATADPTALQTALTDLQTSLTSVSDSVSDVGSGANLTLDQKAELSKIPSCAALGTL